VSNPNGPFSKVSSYAVRFYVSAIFNLKNNIQNCEEKVPPSPSKVIPSILCLGLWGLPGVF
jgi:hypothetical protein